jgi:hypothetical protein
MLNSQNVRTEVFMSCSGHDQNFDCLLNKDLQRIAAQLLKSAPKSKKSKSDNGL